VLDYRLPITDYFPLLPLGYPLLAIGYCLILGVRCLDTGCWMLDWWLVSEKSVKVSEYQSVKFFDTFYPAVGA